MLHETLEMFEPISDQLVAAFSEMLTKYYMGLSRRGFLPFANYGDWGVACFDARQPTAHNNYSVIVLDHEDGYSNPMAYTANFQEMFERAKSGWIWLGAPGWKRKDELS